MNIYLRIFHRTEAATSIAKIDDEQTQWSSSPGFLYEKSGGLESIGPILSQRQIPLSFCVLAYIEVSSPPYLNAG